MMAVSHRQALRLLVRRNELLEGRLLRSVGNKRMPRGVQPSKYLVSVAVLREAMRPDDAARDLESLRLEVVLLRLQLAALRRAVRRLTPRGSVADAT